MFSTYLAWTMTQAGWPFWLAFVVTVAISFAAGVLIERVVIRPVEHAPVLSVVRSVALRGPLLVGGLGPPAWGPWRGPSGVAPLVLLLLMQVAWVAVLVVLASVVVAPVLGLLQRR